MAGSGGLKNRIQPRAGGRSAGAYWERRAESFLHLQGLITRERNFHCRSGEIDLIMMDGSTLVFVEVRFRRNDRHGSGAESITQVKRSRLIRAARYYLAGQRIGPEVPCRFDVISAGKNQGVIAFDWIRNAFETAPG